MATLADYASLILNAPYAAIWLPLVIGVAIGACAFTASRLARKKEQLPLTRPGSAPEHDPFTAGSVDEQRKAYRRHGSMTEVYVALGGQKERPLLGWVLDRSLGGICLQVNAEIKPGSEVAVIPVNAPKIIPWVDIEVRSCRGTSNGFELGCQFVKTPAWSILLMFG